jgi:hypothetical protein
MPIIPDATMAVNTTPSIKYTYGAMPRNILFSEALKDFFGAIACSN